jgi:hypothetical protein
MLGIAIACLMLVVAFILLTCFLARHRWLSASAVLVAILTLCLTIAFPRLPELRAAVGAHWVRLAWYKPQLDKLIRERAKTNETPVIATLGVGGVFSTETGIGYDSSDEFRKPSGTQSASWQRAARETFVEGRCWEAYPLIAHYFAFVFDGACSAKRGGIIDRPPPTSVSP